MSILSLRKDNYIRVETKKNGMTSNRHQAIISHAVYLLSLASCSRTTGLMQYHCFYQKYTDFLSTINSPFKHYMQRDRMRQIVVKDV